jgi:hypothetical protein
MIPEGRSPKGIVRSVASNPHRTKPGTHDPENSKAGAEISPQPAH